MKTCVFAELVFGVWVVVLESDTRLQLPETSPGNT